MEILLVNGSPVNNGATAEINGIIAERLAAKHSVHAVCLGELELHFCKGCRICHTTAKCQIEDDVQRLLNDMDTADSIVLTAPSYWADVPGQLKTFFDRCTPYSNSHEPHASLKKGKKGYAVSLRTGTNANECQHIIDSIAHYYGHMDIQMENSFYFCGIKDKADVIAHKHEIYHYCDLWFG
jgi:multimeric flavodoxin WrbA